MNDLSKIKNDYVLQQIIKVTSEFKQIQKVMLFGSRARGDNTPQSDYDIAVYPYKYPFSDYTNLCSKIDDLDTLYKIDLVVISDKLEPSLTQNIEKEGIIIMERVNKQKNFCKATQRLSEALAEYDKSPSDTMRDGVIQRFEFTTELAWKACKEYLSEIGYAEINGPKPVMREAFSYGMLEDDSVWIKILTDRNLTSHVYDDELANEIFENIKSKYIMQFEKLAKFFIDN